MLALLLVGTLVVAQSDVDAGPQPGDLDDGTPRVDATAPALLDAGPGVLVDESEDGGPQPVAADPRADDDASGAGPVEGAPPVEDPASGAAQPDATTPVHDPATPAVDPTAPRIDPAGERVEAPAPPAEPVDERAPLPEGFGFGGVPAINFDSDNGFGFGVVATMFSYDGKTEPYRLALTLQIFMTSKLVQDHNIVLDWLDVADLPLRLWTRVGYLQSLTQNYCGIGGDVTCDPDVARRAVAGPDGAAAEELTRRYYQRRFINPYGLVQTRWALTPKPVRFEIMAGYRGFYFIPGEWDDKDGDGEPDLFPYPGSLYAQHFPEGEQGFSSAVQLGFMVDTRDNEPAPTEGVWLEASARTSSPLIGSTWEWSGANFTLRGYAPLTTDHKLVLANRFVFDAVVGDPPIQELVRAGGSFDYYLYGGSENGRGIRVQRFIGKLRTFNQTEVRWRFFDAEVFAQKFGFTAAAFADLGLVGAEISDPGPMQLLPGFGGALRLSWNENFIVRFDMGVSPIEDYAPSLYILIGNPF